MHNILKLSVNLEKHQRFSKSLIFPLFPICLLTLRSPMINSHLRENFQMLTQKEGHEKNDQTQNQKTNKQTNKQLRVGQDYTDEIITVWSPV